MLGWLIQRWYKRLMKYHESKRSQQETLMGKTMLLDYSPTYPNAIIRYKSSNMVLHLDSDAAYLTMTGSRGFYDVHFYLSYWPSTNSMKTNTKINGPIHTECKTIRNVVSSAEEVETCGTFNNGKTAINVRPALTTLNHRQPSTPLKTDNSTT